MRTDVVAWVKTAIEVLPSSRRPSSECSCAPTTIRLGRTCTSASLMIPHAGALAAARAVTAQRGNAARSCAAAASAWRCAMAMP